MDLSNHIEDLLYCNDCVIIPSIGGFIVNYAPAAVDFIEQQLYPPKKAVSFNPKLVNNDGLLANHIVQKEHLSYKQASLKVEAFSQQIESQLFNNKVVHFTNIGKLYFNTDSKLEFVPVNTNFLREAYGMPDLTCTPIIRSKDYLIKEKEDKKDKALIVASNKKNLTLLSLLKQKRQLAISAAAILVIFFSSPYIYNAVFSGNNNQPVVSATNNDTINSTYSASILPSLTPTTPKDTATKVTEEPAEDTPKIKSPIVVAVVAKNTEDYVIVLGAFGKQKNADRLAKKLAKDNYLPDVVRKNGLNRVGVQLTCTPEELNTHLTFLQDNYNKKAWVVE